MNEAHKGSLPHGRQGALSRAVRRRDRAYRAGRPYPGIAGRTVVLVDAGLATGATMRAAVAALRKLDPGRIGVAVPVAPADTCEALRAEADEVVCLSSPDPFMAIGVRYEDFPPAHRRRGPRGVRGVAGERGRPLAVMSAGKLPLGTR